jgi:outer membrane protein TolC
MTVGIFSVGGSSILAPLFESGRLRAQADATAARLDQAAYIYRKAGNDRLSAAVNLFQALGGGWVEGATR